MPYCTCASERMQFLLTQAVRTVYGEAHEDDISVWIGEGSQSVIVFLTSCIPKCQLHLRYKNIMVKERRGKDFRHDISLHLIKHKSKETL